MIDLASALFAIAPQLQEGAVRKSDYVMIQCPFHGGGQERTPSCVLSLEKPVFFCHACHTSGHVAQLFKNFGLGSDGVDTILKATGMDKPSKSVRGRGRVGVKLTSGVDPYRGLFVLNEDLLDEYRRAPKMLMRQGFEKKTLRHFEVGYDPTNMRVTFPIRNVYGELVGISGRALLDYQEPRYKIYDDELKKRPGFHVPDEYTMEETKEAVLWHAHIVRPFLYTKEAQTEPFVITEGFKACMWAWQAGYQSTVALVGSYLTDFHAELVASAVQYVVLFLDNNRAGWLGTFHAGKKLAPYGIDVRVAAYPDEREQPDDLNPSETTLAINNPEPYILWRQRDHVRQCLLEAEKSRSKHSSAG